jgi:archaellum component FlaC
MKEVEQLRADIAELRAKYELLIVHCERLVDEDDEQLRTYKDHLTEEIDFLAVLCEQGQQGVKEIFSDTTAAPES